MIPEASLREYKMIFVSANRPEEMESLNASRKGSVQGTMTSGVEHRGHSDCGPTIYALRHSLPQLCSGRFCGWSCGRMFWSARVSDESGVRYVLYLLSFMRILPHFTILRTNHFVFVAVCTGDCVPWPRARVHTQ